MRVSTGALIGVIAVLSGVAVYCFYRAVGLWRGWPTPRIELGNLSEALGALFTFVAAMVALSIAGRDRRERARERHDEEKTIARLVRLDVTSPTNRPAAIDVKVRNFGPLPVLDVKLVKASHRLHPAASWRPQKTSWHYRDEAWELLQRPVLMPNDNIKDTYSTMVEFSVEFEAEAGGEPLAEVNPRTANYQFPSYLRTDLANVVLTIEFTTADGVRWSVSTKGAGADEPVRMTGSSE